ncbi:hypothetical protein BH24ACT13_BH24ACT13_16690 [soil metagenome]
MSAVVVAPAQLETADEVFVTGSMGGVTPVLAVDGRRIGAGRRGPRTERSTKVCAALTVCAGTPVA